MSVRNKDIIWTKEEDNFIKENYNNMTDAEMGRELGQKPHSVQTRRLKLGLKKRSHYWTKEDDDYLRKWYHVKDIHTISKELDRTIQSVRSRAYNLKITNTQDIKDLNDTQAQRIYKEAMKREKYKNIRNMIEHKKSVYSHNIKKNEIYKLKTNTHRNLSEKEMNKYGQKAERTVKVLGVYDYVILVQDIESKTKECVSKVDLYTKEKIMEAI